MKKMKNKKAGQSLIELLLVMMLITVALTSGVMMVMRSLQLSEVSLNRQRAVTISKAVAEYVKKEKELNDWGVFVNSFSASGDLSTHVTTLNNELGGGGEFSITMGSTDNPDGDGTTKDFEVNYMVGWDDLNGHHDIDDSIILYMF